MEVFQEGIALVLSRWSALRTAVENQWGGPYSHAKLNNSPPIYFLGSLNPKVYY
jgi:hypothetical protein